MLMNYFKFVLFIILVTVLSGFSQNKLLDSLFQSVQSQNINSFNPFFYSKFKFTENNISHQVSAAELRSLITLAGDKVVIKNLSVKEAVVLNEKSLRVKDIAFYNCQFQSALVIEKMSSLQSVSFIGCKFNDQVILNDISTQHLNFISNRFEKNLNYRSEEEKNKTTKFLFSYNLVDSLKIEAKNLFRTSSSWGENEFKLFIILANNIKYLLLSGITFQEFCYLGGNVIDRFIASGLTLKQFLFCQYNQINIGGITNLSKDENAYLLIRGNRFRNLTIKSNILRYCGIEENYLNTLFVYDLLCKMSFHLNNNFYRGKKEIVLKSCRITTLTFRHDKDSIRVVSLDTLKTGEELPAEQKFLELPTRESSQRLFIRQRKMKVALKGQLYSLHLQGVEINERSWHVKFQDICKIGTYYRLNPRDSSLSHRHEIYTAIHNAYARQGKWNQADDCYYEYKQFERKNYARLAEEAAIFKFPKILFHNLNWISCGYGIKPLRIFPFAFLAVLLFALFYFLTPQPISNLEEHLVSGDKLKKRLGKLSHEQLKELFRHYDFNFKKHKQDLIDDIISSIGVEELSNLLGVKSPSRYTFDYFWKCFYFSFSTFTTVGLGDWYPSGNLNRTIVMLEGALGWLCLGLFITTYANVLLR